MEAIKSSLGRASSGRPVMIILSAISGDCGGIAMMVWKVESYGMLRKKVDDKQYRGRCEKEEG